MCLLMLLIVLVVPLRENGGYVQFYMNLSSINCPHFYSYWGALSFLNILSCLILSLQPSGSSAQILSSLILNAPQWNQLSVNSLPLSLHRDLSVQSFSISCWCFVLLLLDFWILEKSFYPASSKGI